MKAISSMATRRLLAELSEAAASAGLPEITVESVGGVDAAARVAAGEHVDLVFLASDALDQLATDGHVDAASRTPLVRSRVAVAVPTDRERPRAHADGIAFADADAMRAALRDATRVGYSTGPSGSALLKAIADWGITDELAGRLVQARPGVPVAQLLADGEVDLGFQQFSELAGQPGIRILGALPDDCAIDTVFSGAVATQASDPQGARRILDYFASSAATPIARAHGFDAP